MKIGYISPTISTVELLPLIEQMKSLGVELEHVSINQDFDSFITRVPDNSQIIVSSYTHVFGSLTEFFARAIELAKRNSSISSIAEPDLVIDSVHIELVKKLQDIGTTLRAIRTRNGLSKAKEKGIKLGRPHGSTKIKDKIEEVTRLRQVHKLTVAKACQAVGCEPRTYYRHLDKISVKQ